MSSSLKWDTCLRLSSFFISTIMTTSTLFIKHHWLNGFAMKSKCSNTRTSKKRWNHARIYNFEFLLTIPWNSWDTVFYAKLKVHNNRKWGGTYDLQSSKKKSFLRWSIHNVHLISNHDQNTVWYHKVTWILHAPIVLIKWEVEKTTGYFTLFFVCIFYQMQIGWLTPPEHWKLMVDRNIGIT